MTPITLSRPHRKKIFCLSSQLQLLLMLLPAVVICLVFNYATMGGIIIAFQKYNIIKGLSGSTWVGLDNLKKFFDSAFAWRVIRNSLLINIFSTCFSLPCSMILSLSLNEIKCVPFKRVSQTISYLPHFISTVVLVGIVKIILANSGVVNTVIESMGGETIQFLAKPKYFRTIFIASDIWQHLGWNTILYLAALNGIDASLYEAAEIDGANHIQKIAHISIPAIMTVLSTVLILGFSSILSVGFEKVHLLYNTATYETADVISTFLYRKSFDSSTPDYGQSTAVGLFQSLISVIFVYISNYVTKKLNGAGLI